LLDKHGNAKLADFGLSNILSEGNRFTAACGSIEYVAPGIFHGNNFG
jgi:serine/threonine protein kinase